MSALRLIGNALVLPLWFLALVVALWIVYGALDLLGVGVAFALVVLWLALPRGLPGGSLVFSLRRFGSLPIVRGNARMMGVLVASLAVVAAFWAGAFAPLAGGEIHPERVVVETLVEDEPFDLALDPDRDLGVASFALLAKRPGLALVDLEDAGARPRFVELPPAAARFVTLVPERDLAIAVSPSYERPPDIPMSVTHLVDTRTGLVTERVETDFEDLYRVRYDPRDGRAYLVQKGRAENLIVVTLEELLAGAYLHGRSFYLGTLPNFKDVRLGPRPGLVLTRGDSTRNVKEVDVETEEIRSLGHYGFGVPPVTTDLFGCDRGDRLYALRGISHTLTVIDRARFTEVAERWIGGLPSAGAVLHGRDALAVGTYHGRRLTILDAASLEPVARIVTCPRIRTMAWDEKHQTLYFGDACGLKRLRFSDGPGPAAPSTVPPEAGSRPAPAP